MWTLQDGVGYHNMDPETSSKQDLVNMLKANFTTRYENNRVPLALWLHSGWLDSPANVEGLNDFLSWARTNDNVWIVPVGKLVTWMKNPLPRTQCLWGTSRYVSDGGTSRIESSGVWGSAIESGAADRIIGSFVANGDADSLQVTKIAVRQTKPVAAELHMDQDPVGRSPHFHWQASAPMYELQGRSSLQDGDWQVIQRLYDDLEVTLPTDTPYQFFRLQSLY